VPPHIPYLGSALGRYHRDHPQASESCRLVCTVAPPPPHLPLSTHMNADEGSTLNSTVMKIMPHLIQPHTPLHSPSAHRQGCPAAQDHQGVAVLHAPIASPGDLVLCVSILGSAFTAELREMQVAPSRMPFCPGHGSQGDSGFTCDHSKICEL
jgi:hypothetical protein